MPGASPSVSSVQNPTVIYNNAGVYSVTLTATNGSGSNTSIKSVTVNATPTITVNSPTICSGQTTTLVASGATTYTWNNGAISSSIAVTPSATSVYTVTGKTAGCSSTRTTNVIVNPVPVASSNVWPATSPGCANGSATINVSSGTSPYTFVWNPPVSTSSVASNLNGTSGGTNYTVTVTDVNNCSVVHTFSVDCVTGIQNVWASNGVRIYPNPTNAWFVIESVYPAYYRIYNTLGQLIKEDKISEGVHSIDIGDYGKGVYYVLITGKDGFVHSFRVMVE